MNILIHFKKQTLTNLTQKLIVQNEKFVKKEFDLDKTLMLLLSEVQEYYQQIGESNKESDVSQLKNHLDLATSGIDPLKMERVKTRKREMVRIACFHCLSNLGEILNTSLYDIQGMLQSAEEMLNQVVLSAYQSKLITDNIINALKTIDDVALLWENLKKNEQILVIDKKLRLTVNHQDINILLDQSLAKLKTN